MAGNKRGGLKVANKLLERDPDYFKKLGRKGGSVTGVIKGFASNPALASRAGKIGGKKSRPNK